MRTEWVLLLPIFFYFISSVAFTWIQKTPEIILDSKVHDSYTTSFIISNFVTNREYSALQKSIFYISSLKLWYGFSKTETDKRNDYPTPYGYEATYVNLPVRNFSVHEKCQEHSKEVFLDITQMILSLKHKVHEDPIGVSDSKMVIASLDAILQKIWLESGNRSMVKERLPEKLQRNSTSAVAIELSIEDVLLTTILFIKFAFWTAIFLIIAAAGIALWTNAV